MSTYGMYNMGIAAVASPAGFWTHVLVLLEVEVTTGVDCKLIR